MEVPAGPAYERFIRAPGWRGWLGEGTYEPELPSERRDHNPKPGDPVMVRVWFPEPGARGWLLGRGHWEQQAKDPVPVIPGRLYRHRKGGHYLVLQRALDEATLRRVVVYQSTDPRDGRVWVRPYGQFSDGRFTLLDALPNPEVQP